MSIVKVSLLGEGRPGMSSLVAVLMGEELDKVQDCTIEESYRRPIDTPSGKCLLDVLDSSSDSVFFKSLRKMYIRSADIVVVCFDPTSSESIAGAARALEAVEVEDTMCDVFVVQCKSDLLPDGGSEKERRTRQGLFEGRGAEAASSDATPGADSEQLQREREALFHSVPRTRRAQVSTKDRDSVMDLWENVALVGIGRQKEERSPPSKMLHFTSGKRGLCLTMMMHTCQGKDGIDLLPRSSEQLYSAAQRVALQSNVRDAPALSENACVGSQLPLDLLQKILLACDARRFDVDVQSLYSQLDHPAQLASVTDWLHRDVVQRHMPEIAERTPYRAASQVMAELYSARAAHGHDAAMRAFFERLVHVRMDLTGPCSVEVGQPIPSDLQLFSLAAEPVPLGSLVTRRPLVLVAGSWS